MEMEKKALTSSVPEEILEPISAFTHIEKELSKEERPWLDEWMDLVLPII